MLSLPVVAGMIFCSALLIFVDGIITAHKESNVEHRFSFTMSIPAIFTTVGLFLSLLVSPGDIREDKSKAKVILFISWMLMIASTISALTVVLFCYYGKQERVSAMPGCALVIYTSILPICTSVLWLNRARSEYSFEDEFDVE